MTWPIPGHRRRRVHSSPGMICRSPSMNRDTHSWPAAPPDDTVQTKAELAGLLRTYLNKHYCASFICLLFFSFFIDVFVWQIWHLPGSATVHRSRRLQANAANSSINNIWCQGLAYATPIYSKRQSYYPLSNIFDRVKLLTV